jgi:hypothetical protein
MEGWRDEEDEEDEEEGGVEGPRATGRSPFPWDSHRLTSSVSQAGVNEPADGLFPMRVDSAPIPSQKSFDEVFRRDRLCFVTCADQRLEMPILSNDEIRMYADRAIGEFVIIAVGRNGEKLKECGDAKE